MKKRVLCSILTVLMASAALVSCGGGNDSSTASGDSASTSGTTSEAGESGDASEGGEASETGAYVPNFDEDPYTVHFQYLVSAEQPGQDAVDAAVNELALKELNMNVDLIPQTGGTWTQTMSMSLAANEPMDLFAGGSDSFGTYIESGYILDWTPYLQYLPDVVETLGEDINAGYVGDFLVGFTEMKERGYQPGLIARKDIMDELGYSPDDFNVSISDYSSYDKLTELFAAVQAAHPDMLVLGGPSTPATYGVDLADCLGNNFGMLDDFGQSDTIINYFETDDFKFLCNLSRDWFLSGYLSADAATTSDWGTVLVKAGNCFGYFTRIKPNADVEVKSQTGYDVYTIPVSDTVVTSSFSVNAMLYMLANASEDPVKAAAFYNWAFQSQEFEDLINWGVEGVDWVENEDGLAAYPEGVDVTSVAYHNDFGYAYPNQFVGHAWEGNDPDIWEQYEEYNASLLRSKAFGFNFDSTAVTNEIAACNSVFDQYDNDIFTGSIDIDEGLAAMNEALYGAGLQTIMDEKQRQLDEWFAQQNG